MNYVIIWLIVYRFQKSRGYSILSTQDSAMIKLVANKCLWNKCVDESLGKKKKEKRKEMKKEKYEVNSYYFDFSEGHDV